MNNSCPLCGSKNTKLIKNGVRDNPEIDVLKCLECSLEFLSDFSHVSNEFYREGKMHSDEVFKWIENTKTDDIRRFNFLKDKISRKKVLDFGAGSGNFVRLANCEGFEIDVSLTDYFRANRMKIFSAFEDLSRDYDYITMFHVLEHLKEPVEELKQISKLLNPDGRIVIEVPNCDDALLSMYRSDEFAEFTYWGCHVFNYNLKTLASVVDKAGLSVERVEFVQRYPFINHLYWLINKLPAGHKKWAAFDFKVVNSLYAAFLGALKKTDTILVFAKLK